MSDVINIQDAKKERKYNAGELARNVSLAIEGFPPHDWPRFDTGRFLAMADPKGERIIFERDDADVIRPASPTVVDTAILRYLHGTIPNRSKWRLAKVQTVRAIQDCRRWWLTATEPVNADDIKDVAFASEPGPAYHRLAFDRIEGVNLERDCPLAHELMNRTTNADALMAWVGSLFDPKSSKHQYCWLVGRGGDGKSSLMRLLSKAFGPAYASEQPPTRGDRFWTAGLLGKRLVTFGDMDNAGFVTTGLFKSLTGDDLVRVEFKGGATVSLRLPAKFMASSNSMPAISLSPADLRRLILSQIAAPDRLYEGDYEADLEKELAPFISYCLDRYEPYRGKRQIECDTQGAVNVARQATSEWDTIIEHHFSSAGELGTEILAERMEEIIKTYYPTSKRDRDEFRAHLRAHVGVDGRLPRQSTASRPRYYPGLYEKTSAKPF